MKFHLNIEKFLSKRLIESDRLEFKKGWNPASIYRSICAFANDFENIGGGYILIGVEEENGVAKRPVKGIAVNEIAKIQREINAVYHKNYQVREPVEVCIFPNKIEIINYGGLDRSVRIEDLNKGIIRSRRYRNSRIGDFFKELDLCEAKGTGIPTIRQQMKIYESPLPVFETDENRTYFIITLPINEIYLNGRPLVDNVVDNESFILNLIRQNNEISSTEVAKTMGMSARTAQRYFKTLQNKGIITRVGPDNGGYWQVNTAGGSQSLTLKAKATKNYFNL